MKLILSDKPLHNYEINFKRQTAAYSNTSTR